jgi:ubiquitin carboxyl-terminal hydrolase L3
MISLTCALGLDTNAFQFCDVLSTEEWALSMVPTPAIAMIMLFPISDASERHRQEVSLAELSSTLAYRMC